MQYKIPVQIENEDKIVLNLSMKQLAILVIWWWIAYSLFKWLAPVTWMEVAAFPAILIFLLTAAIVFLNISEMTFLPYILNLIRQSINWWAKTWHKWVDSYSMLDIWYITRENKKKEINVNTDSKIEKINELQDKIKNI